jgi:hypothetical protein
MFFLKLLSEVFPNLKDFNGISVPKKLGETSFSFRLKDLINFKELEKQFYLFTCQCQLCNVARKGDLSLGLSGLGS